MPTQEEITEQKRKKQQASNGLFGSMGGIQKAMLLIFGLAIFFLIWTFAFGGINNFYQLVFFIISFVAIAGLMMVMLTAISWYFAPDVFSPKKDFFTKTVNLAVDLKPTNVYNLYFKGDIGKKMVKAGKITGLIGIPYLVGKPKFHEEDIYKDGKIIAKKGSPVYEKSLILKRNMPIFEKIEYSSDGDTLFIYESGWFLFKRKHYLRCHRSLHSDLNGDVFIEDINPVPYGAWEYPYKQLQEQPARIMLQNQLEVILATHDHQADLISQGVDAAVYYNPAFRIATRANAEMVGQDGQ